MVYLIDTHAILWMMFAPQKVPQRAQDIFTDNKLHKFISVASMWEIAIKNRIDKLPLEHGLKQVFEKIDALGVGHIGILPQHIETFNKLPLLHRDPFDGIIIATAIYEDITIITNDEKIQKYDVKWVW